MLAGGSKGDVCGLRKSVGRFIIFLVHRPPSLSFCAPAAAEGVIIGYPSRSMTELPNYLEIRKGFYHEDGLEARFV